MKGNKMKTIPVSLAIISVPVLNNRKSSHINTRDIEAINALQDELSIAMNEEEVKQWTDVVLDFCKRMKIAPSRLPINKDFPGDMNPAERHELYLCVMDRVI